MKVVNYQKNELKTFLLVTYLGDWDATSRFTLIIQFITSTVLLKTTAEAIHFLHGRLSIVRRLRVNKIDLRDY